MIGRLEWRAALKQQVIEFSVTSSDAGLLEGDPHRLRQVVANLVDNALKYSPPRKAVRLRLERADQMVRFSVSDEGPGIGPEDLAKIFIPFARLANRPAGGEASHGLGLSIAHELVRLHGGRLTVVSAVGQGSTFTMEIPVGAASAGFTRST
ncbi:MAG: ATP-binding protein [Lacunisphaera sp.]